MQNMCKIQKNADYAKYAEYANYAKYVKDANYTNYAKHAGYAIYAVLLKQCFQNIQANILISQLFAKNVAI